MCQHSYEYSGHRSYGDNIPGYAQGAYFPGDEPGTRCRLSGDACGNPCGDTPEDCAANRQTEWLCPECQKECFDSALWKSGESGKLFCRECEGEWAEEELPRAFTDLLIFLVREKEDALDHARVMQTESAKLRGVLETVRDAVAV